MDPHRLLKACLLRGLGNALLIASETYAYTLFLSTYSQKNIPYLYLALAFFGFIGMQMSQTFLKKDLARFMKVSNAFFMGGLLLFLVFIHASFHWLPFAFAIFVITAVTIANTTNWIAVTALFDLREFKSLNAWVSSSSTIGSIATGLLIPLLLIYFHAIILFYLILALFFLNLLLSTTLRFALEKPEPQARHRLPFKLNQDALFISTFAAIVLMLVLFIFSDFSLKSELAHNFDKKEIGQFLAPFFAVTSALTILVQIFALPAVLRRFGVLGLIMACPVIYIIMGAALFIYPSFWTATVLAGTAMVLRYSFFMMGNQMLLNVYPPAIRNEAKYQVESYGRSLGMALGASILIAFALIENLRLVSMGVILAAVLLIVVCLQLGKSYFSTLKNAINLHRFDTDYLSTERANKQLILKVASQALLEKNQDTLLFGLSLFKRMKSKEVPPTVIAALSSEYDAVKKSAIRVLEASGNESVVPYLMKQLAHEKNPEIAWHLVNGVLHFSSDFLIAYAMSSIASDDPPIKAAAIAVFLQTQGESEIKKNAEASLHHMVHHPEARYRYWAANILKTGALKNPLEYLLKLLNDSDDSVVRNVLFAATLCPEKTVIANLIEKLSKKKLSYSVGKTLVRIGAPAIPQLLDHVHQLQNLQEMRVEMILFAKFSAIEAELALVDLLLSVKGELLDKCVISLAYRAKQFELSKKSKQVIQKQIFREVEELSVLRRYYKKNYDPDVKNELRSRIFYGRKRYLYLLASCTTPKIILQIIPTLLSADHHSRAYTNAIELLELSINDPVLRNTISAALESHFSRVESQFKPFMDDAWLRQIVAFKRGAGNVSLDHLIAKVAILRKLEIFSFLSAETLQNIAKIAHFKKSAAKEVIFKEGEKGNGLYIVISGGVNIVKNGQQLKFISSGGFFGELALLDNTPRYAAAITNEDSEFFFIEKNDFIRLTDEIPEILKAVIKKIIAYLRNQETV